MGNIETPKVHRLDEARVADAISDEYARRILATCISRARSVKEMEQETGLPQATVYRHVERLVSQALLLVERSAITPDGKRYELYRSRLRAARIEVDASGVRVLWEPMEAMEEKLARIWNTMRGT